MNVISNTAMGKFLGMLVVEPRGGMGVKENVLCFYENVVI